MAKITRAPAPNPKPAALEARQKSVSQIGARARPIENGSKQNPGPPLRSRAFSRFSKANPEPKGELEHLNPYTLLVAVVLSAQATDAGVNKATRARLRSPTRRKRCSTLGEEQVRDYIKTIGLYRNKAKNVIALSEKLIAEFDSVVPRTRAELIAAARPQDRQYRAQQGLR